MVIRTQESTWLGSGVISILFLGIFLHWEQLRSGSKNGWSEKSHWNLDRHPLFWSFPYQEWDDLPIQCDAFLFLQISKLYSWMILLPCYWSLRSPSSSEEFVGLGSFQNWSYANKVFFSPSRDRCRDEKYHHCPRLKVILIGRWIGLACQFSSQVEFTNQEAEHIHQSKTRSLWRQNLSIPFEWLQMESLDKRQ